LHGKRLSVELIVRVLACWAAGLGRRATARVCEVAPDTVRQWLVAAAEQLQALTSSCLCDMHVTQLQLDELYAVIRALHTGEISEDDALKRLGGSRPWVWTAIDPVSKVWVCPTFYTPGNSTRWGPFSRKSATSQERYFIA
jgi:hypothetical protein